MKQMPSWRPKYGHDTREYQRSNRPAAVSHNQFVSKPSVPSKIVIPETSGFHRSHGQQQVQHHVKPEPTNNSQKNEGKSRLDVNGATLAIKALRSISGNDAQPSQFTHKNFQISSSRRRITDKMSVKNERDSGNSSPTDLAVNTEISTLLPKVNFTNHFEIV